MFADKGSCNIETCWLKLPPFKEVARKLHDSLDQAVKVIYVNNQRHKFSNPSTVRKSNKKRSSSPAIPVNGLTRSSNVIPYSQANQLQPQQQLPIEPSTAAFERSHSFSKDSANIIGSRKKGASNKRHAQALNGLNSDGLKSCETCGYRVAAEGANSSLKAAVNTGVNTSSEPADSNHLNSINSSGLAQVDLSASGANLTLSSSSPAAKRRPVARSIGISPHTISPSALDLLYYEESPEFCLPNERYNIRGTKGRTCTNDNPNSTNNCERLCCGRGYRTELRIEKYKCECKFKFCCEMICETCTRRKVTHKCL